MKKIISIILTAILAIILTVVPVSAEGIEIGSYFQIGSYNGAPILWRYMADEYNGKLIVSDKAICFKTFAAGDNRHLSSRWGSDFWEESTIRKWLNSKAGAGEIEWPNGNTPSAEGVQFSGWDQDVKYPYADEAGFLNENNFSVQELSIMKTISQWQMLSENRIELAENGETRPYLFQYTFGSDREPQTVHTNEVSEFKDAFRGAMYRVSDTIFLLNELQIYDIWNNFGEIRARRTNESILTEENNNEYCWYWLITPALARAQYDLARYNGVTSIKGNGEYRGVATHPNELGVRPAFYLNEANLIIKSGSGTEEDPYIVDGAGQNGVAVFSNGEELSMDQKPVEENERLLVPARAVFESLGAEVEWDEEKEVVTATDGETEIVMQIDNAVMEKNKKGEEEEISLEAAPRIIGERTMVPLRAVSEAFSAKVDYIEELNRVVIDKQPAPSPDPNWCPPWYKRMFGCSK